MNIDEDMRKKLNTPMKMEEVEEAIKKQKKMEKHQDPTVIWPNSIRQWGKNLSNQWQQ